MQKLLTKKHNKGFTLIELIVVIAVIAVLVLLATPKFLDYTRDAKIAQIKNDIKVAEEVVEEYLIKNEDHLPDSLGTIDIVTPLDEGRLWETKGIVTEIDTDGGSYVNITEMDEIKQINSKLPGQFVANNGGKVYYVHIKELVSSGESEDEVEEEQEEWVCETETKIWPARLTNSEIADLVENQNYIPIANADELNQIRQVEATLTFGLGTDWEGSYLSGPDKKYIQVADIDLSSYAETYEPFGSGAADRGWLPIGNWSNMFTGIYNGGNFEISNLYQYVDTQFAQTGIFGIAAGITVENMIIANVSVTDSLYLTESYMTHGATVLVSIVDSGDIRFSNIKVDNVQLKSRSYVSVLSGDTSADTTIIDNIEATNISIEGNGIERAGLLIASDYSGQTDIANIKADIDLNAMDQYVENVGGLIGEMGYNNSPSFENIEVEINMHNIYDAYNVGGIGATVPGAAILENVHVTGDITITNQGEDIGGLFGEAYEGQAIKSSFNGNINAGPLGMYVGGIIGYGGVFAFEDVYTTGNYSGFSQIGGLIGAAYGGTIVTLNSHTMANITGSSEAGQLVGTISAGTITTQNTYHINPSETNGNLVDLSDMGNVSTFTSWDFEQTWTMGEDGYPVFNVCTNGSPSSNSSGTTDPSGGDYVLATDSDFLFISNSKAPNSYGGVQGYYKYIGSYAKIEIPEKINGNTLYDYYRMFESNTKIRGVKSNSVYVTNMEKTFAYSKIEDVADLNTENVTNMKEMFLGASSSGINMSNRSMLNLATMEAMFKNSIIGTLTMENINIPNVTNMYEMFFYSDISEVDIDGINSIGVTNMDSMFEGAKIVTINLADLDTDNVTTMEQMFYCSLIDSLNLNNFNTSKLVNMIDMFSASSAMSIDIRNFDTSNVINMRGLFSRTQAEEILLSGINTENVQEMAYMFNRTNVKSVDLSSFNTTNVISMYYMFEESSIENIDISSFTYRNNTNLYGMFWGAKAQSINFGSSVVRGRDFRGMFAATNMVELDISKFSYPTSIFGMFYLSNIGTIYVKNNDDKILLEGIVNNPEDINIVAKY